MATTHAAAFTRSRPWAASEFTDLLQHPGCFAVGDRNCFALVRVVLDEAELLTIAARPEFRRQGLARACMVHWQAIAHTRGATRAFLEVAANNSAAFSLYQSGGYETCGLRPGYYSRPDGNPVDGVVMARALGPRTPT